MKLYAINIVVSNIIKLNEIIFIEIEYMIDRKRNKLLIKAQLQPVRKLSAGAVMAITFCDGIGR